ncbi:MAG: Fe-S oxidoreductase, partial [Bacteroidota bacterium]
MISSIIFTILLLCGGYLFYKNASKIRRNVLLGKEIDRSDNSSERWKLMTLVAIGQSKMVVRPVAGIMHILLYAGFVIINIEVIEIVIDGIFGTHRVLSFMGGFYNFLIASFEWLALGVIVGCVVFFVRRNVIK